MIKVLLIILICIVAFFFLKKLAIKLGFVYSKSTENFKEIKYKSKK